MKKIKLFALAVAAMLAGSAMAVTWDVASGTTFPYKFTGIDVYVRPITTFSIEDKKIDGKNKISSIKIGASAKKDLDTAFVEVYCPNAEITALELCAGTAAKDSKKYAVAYSSAYPFDKTKILGIEEPTAIDTAAGRLDLYQVQTLTIPSGTKSLRIYRTITVNSVNYGDGSTIYLYRFNVEGGAPINYPFVKSFTMGEIAAAVDTAAKTITAVLPFGTNRVDAINNAVVKMGGTAKTYSISGDVLTAIDSAAVEKNIDYDLKGITVSTTQYFTVSYMDGSTLLGSEEVVKDGFAVNYAQFQNKPLSTFVNWYTEPEKTNIADFASTAITEDKSFYGDWNVRYAESVDFAALAASKPKIDSLLTAKGYAYKLGSLTDWDTNNELYTGYKFKNSGDSIQFNLKENHYFIMNLGAIKTPLYVSDGTKIDTLATNTASTSEYEYQAIGGDKVITLFIKAKNTVVFKQFNILAEKIATADLKSITVNGNVIPGFKKDSLNYSYALPYGTTEMPVIAATPADKEAVAVVDVITSLTQLVNIVVTNGELQKTYTVQLSVAAADKFLYEVVFSNGAKGAIDNGKATIVVPYLDGAGTPTLVSDSVSAGATAQMTGEDKLTVTGVDQSEKEFSIEFKALSAPSFSADTITFDGGESYVYAHYGWEAGKGYKFAKDVNDADNMRITEGKSRLYMALPACYSVNLISGSGGKRNIKVTVNGVVSSVTSTAAANVGIDVLLSTTEANFIAIESNGSNGDGGLIKMVMTKENPTTKLAEMKAGEQVEKFIMNGKVYFRHNGQVFNALGQEIK